MNKTKTITFNEKEISDLISALSITCAEISSFSHLQHEEKEKIIKNYDSLKIKIDLATFILNEK